MEHTQTFVVLGVPVDVQRFTDVTVTGRVPDLHVERTPWSAEKIRQWRRSRLRVWDDTPEPFVLTVLASSA